MAYGAFWIVVLSSSVWSYAMCAVAHGGPLCPASDCRYGAMHCAAYGAMEYAVLSYSVWCCGICTTKLWRIEPLCLASYCPAAALATPALRSTIR
eukprot:3940680-Rhodomonas_salina.4